MPVYGYEGPPLVLSHHISIVHPMPVHMIKYDMVLLLQVPVSEPRLLLFAEEDARLFFGRRRAQHHRAYCYVSRLH